MEYHSTSLCSIFFFFFALVATSWGDVYHRYRLVSGLVVYFLGREADSL